MPKSVPPKPPLYGAARWPIWAQTALKISVILMAMVLFTGLIVVLGTIIWRLL